MYSKTEKVVLCLICLVLLLSVCSPIASAVSNENKTYLMGEAKLRTIDQKPVICAAGLFRNGKIEVQMFSDSSTTVRAIAASYSDSGQMLGAMTRQVTIESSVSTVSFSELQEGSAYRVFLLDETYCPCSAGIQVLTETAYFVTFRSDEGTALSVQAVPAGGSAVPPSVPAHTGFVFSGWQGDYENVTSDRTVTAVYSEYTGETYSVTFYADDGETVLKAVDVPEEGFAEPPAAPEKVGVSFLGWSGQYAGVTKNTIVRALYSDATNVFTLSSSEGSVGGTVTILLSLKGAVKTCGFDLNLMYDEALQLVSYDDDLDMDVVVNTTAYANGIKLNFSGTRDVTRQRDIISLTFRIEGTAKPALPIWLVMNSIYELVGNDPAPAEYVCADSDVRLR